MDPRRLPARCRRYVITLRAKELCHVLGLNRTTFERAMTLPGERERLEGIEWTVHEGGEFVPARKLRAMRMESESPRQLQPRTVHCSA